jgi:two-component system chemotaxis sensor kinase CheA
VPKDPYQYFRTEAREILEGLGRGVLQLEAGATPEVTQLLLRLAHTLKGAARVVKLPRIAERAHEIEDALAPLRDRATSVPRERIDHLLGLVDAIAADVTALDTPGEAPAPARAPAEETLRPVHADTAEMDTLLDGVAEANVHLRSIRRELGALERARHLVDLLADQLAPSLARDVVHAEGGSGALRARSLAGELRDLVTRLERVLPATIDQVERETQQVRDAAERLRLLPVSSVFASLERTTRDAARATGKQAAFVAKGGDVRLDAQVLGVVQSALVQAVRNAVAHGIETETERMAAGKSPSGRVSLDVVRRGSRVVFTCNDDGRGVDIDAVRRAAIAKGLLASTTQQAGADDVVRLLLGGGLTTSGAVTEVSGRGVGLDVVRAAVARLGGEAAMRTEAGRGASLEIVVPVSLASLDALVVEAGGIAAAIPLEAVRGTMRVAASDVAHTATGESIVHAGVAIPFVPLARALRAKETAGQGGRALSAVVVASAASLAAFSVDRLRGTANVVMRPLPALAVVDSLVAGASLDAEGDPQLVLDADRLVALATSTTDAPAREAVTAAPILVIDDSLTTRMLEQSILESAGYEVDTATSAEEGLEKARRKRYGLFLVDVEMPGMDGFTFVATTRRDPLLSAVPAILVTSRDAPEDRRRGQEAGASSYVVKSEFDQVQLLDTIRKLVG